MALDAETFFKERSFEDREVYSGGVIIELPKDILEPVVTTESTMQFSRSTVIAADVSAAGEVVDVQAAEEEIAYKNRMKWNTGHVNHEPEYWNSLRSMAQFCLVGQVELVQDLHGPATPPMRRMRLLIEHTRRFYENGRYSIDPAMHEPHFDLDGKVDGVFLPMLSGTTNIARNVLPTDFGYHIDPVQDETVLLGLTAQEPGTYFREGHYNFTDPAGSQASVNAAGEGLDERQISNNEFLVADARYLLHSAPSSMQLKGWRDFIRTFAVPEFKEPEA